MDNYTLYPKYRHKIFSNLVLNTTTESIVMESLLAGGKAFSKVKVTFSNKFNLKDLPSCCNLFECIYSDEYFNLPGDATDFVISQVVYDTINPELGEVCLTAVGSLSDCWVGEGEIITLA